MNSKLLTILTLIIAVVALVVSIAALNKAGGQADVREAIESFKSENETTVNDLRKLGGKNVAEIETKLQLMEAKCSVS